jgi:hypothetical protein
VGEDSARERTEQSRRTWSVATPGWERNAELVARTTEPVSAWVLDHVRLAPGDVVLELGAGPGDFGLRLATAVASSGRVISTDFVPAMVDVARRRAGERGLANMEFRVMDAQDVDLDDRPSMPSSTASVRCSSPIRSARPATPIGWSVRASRYATVVWGLTEANPMFPLFGRTLAKLGFLGGGPPAADTLDLARPDVTRGLLERTGFADVVVDEVDLPLTFESFDELWVMPSEIAGPIAECLRGLDRSDFERAKDAIRNAAEPYRVGDGFVVPALALCACAVR